MVSSWPPSFVCSASFITWWLFSRQAVPVGPLPHVGIQVAMHTANLSSPWDTANSLWHVQDYKAVLGCQQLVFHGYGVPWMPVLQKEAGGLVKGYLGPTRPRPSWKVSCSFDLQVGRLFFKVTLNMRKWFYRYPDLCQFTFICILLFTIQIISKQTMHVPTLQFRVNCYQKIMMRISYIIWMLG